jgi:hypothetical protein
MPDDNDDRNQEALAALARVEANMARLEEELRVREESQIPVMPAAAQRELEQAREALRERDEELRQCVIVRQRGCQCGDDEACAFVVEKEGAEARVVALEEALRMTEGHLSLIRYCGALKWGKGGIPSLQAVDQTISAARQVLAGADGTTGREDAEKAKADLARVCGELEQAREALRKIEANARGWHRDIDNKAAALGVIAMWAGAALGLVAPTSGREDTL